MLGIIITTDFDIASKPLGRSAIQPQLDDPKTTEIKKSYACDSYR